jgi:hypothetical protein
MKKQQRGGGSKARNGGRTAEQGPMEPSPRELLDAIVEARKLQPGETSGCAAAVNRFNEATDRVKAIPITLTLEEVCRLIGEGVDAQRFASTAFDALAHEIEAVAAIDGSGTGTEVWRPLLSIAERARLASKVEKRLSK